MAEKRAWKTTEDTSRAFSNQAYRDHRLSELELNVRSIEEVCESDNFPAPGTVLARRFVNGLFYFSGGGTTQKDTAKSTSEKQLEGRLLRRHLVNSSWLSFGLSTAIQGENFDFSCPSSTDFVRVKLSERIFREIGQSTSAVQDDGFIDFSGLFSDSTKPLDVEIGAGHGDWIVHQAAKRKDRNHIAVELRADRVAQIFAKGVLQVSGPLENLCVVGDESNAFLTQRLRPGSASNIFVNHPEPPTQAFGEDDSDLRAIMNGADEPAHMLSSSALMSAATCLIDQGQIVVVTDNKCYARLLAATVLKVNRKNNVKLQSVKFPTKSSGLRVIEDFSKHGKGRGELSVLLYEGQPCEAIGHALVESRDGRGSSYFDRLWRTGASNHASQRERYILVLKKA